MFEADQLLPIILRNVAKKGTSIHSLESVINDHRYTLAMRQMHFTFLHSSLSEQTTGKSQT